MVKSNYLQFVIACLFLCLSSSLIAQTKTEQEDQAYMYFNSGDYATAYLMFDKLNAKYPKEEDYKLKLGLCCLYFPEKNARAIEIFQEMKNETKSATADYYLGKAYQVNYKFDEALAVLEPLVEALSGSKKEEDKAIVADATLGILNCKNGKQLIQNKVIADITNLGPPINTSELEAVPVITADESIMIFTYAGAKSTGGKQNESLKPDPNGKYLLDIYKSEKKADGSWGNPNPIDVLNTNGNDAAIAISPDGQKLFVFFSDAKNSGDIYVSKLNNNEFSKPEPLNANINTPEYWEGSCSVSADGKFLYFSSERPGGMGGRDIWVSELINGDWGPAVNLGPKVNTAYDDDAPFIHPDGITLFLSSKGHLSIGGYDIMFTIKKDNDWTEPKSMGVPLNTTNDDSFYVINSKGDKGFFSSYRAGAGGRGEKDIYMVTPGILGEKPIVALLKGMVYGNDKPIEAKIEVLKAGKENIGPYISDKSTGKYLMALSPGSIYQFKISCEGFETVEETLDIENLNAYIEKNKDFHLFSADVIAAKKATEAAKDSVKKDAIVVTNPVATNPVETKTEESKPVDVKPEEKSVTEPAKNETTTLPKEEKVESPKEKVTTKKTKKVKEEKPEPTSEVSEKEAKNGLCDEQLPDLTPLKSKSLNDPSFYSQLLALAGNYCAKDLTFKVQIGAYRMPANFKYQNLKGLGKVDSETFPDGITRFTQKEFKTLKEAEKHRKKVIAKGQTDAWIVVVKDGKRYTLEDFIMVDFQSKTIN